MAKCYEPSCTIAVPESSMRCRRHGCSWCGGVVLADSEEWSEPLCYDCFETVCGAEYVVSLPFCTTKTICYAIKGHDGDHRGPTQTFWRIG